MTNDRQFKLFLLITICILLGNCLGCQKNTLSSLDISFQSFAHFDDQYRIGFITTKPLDSVPVVFYSVEKNAEGINDVVITFFRKTPNSIPSNIHQLTVIENDEKGYIISIPLKSPEDYPVQLYYADKKKLITVSCSPENTSEETTPE